MGLVQIYKEDNLFLGLDPYYLPVTFTGSILVVKAEFSNVAIQIYAGTLTPFINENPAGNVFVPGHKLWLNKAKYVNIALPYFPNTYQLMFKCGWWLRLQSFILTIWEYT